MLKTASVKCFLLVGFRFVHVNILAKKRESPYIQSWTKLLRKLHTWGAFFLNFVADRFFPSPPSPWKQCCWVFKRKPDPQAFVGSMKREVVWRQILQINAMDHLGYVLHVHFIQGKQILIFFSVCKSF